MNKYVLVTFPEIQDFMEHPRWSECIFCQEIEGHPCEDSTYAVPKDLYKEVISLNNIPEYLKESIGKKYKRIDSKFSGMVVGYDTNDEAAILQLMESNMGWTIVDSNDIILIEGIPNYWYISKEEFLEKWEQV